MKTTIVTTTIYVPTFLKAYAENIKLYGHRYVNFIVIGDRKTPATAVQFCEGLENCEYWDLNQQNAWLHDNGLDALANHLPENSIARRNIGHLIAYTRGSDRIIMLDDDNLATTQDVIKHHGVVGQRAFRMSYGSSSGWFNVCSALKEKHGVEFYARGYPPSQRWKDDLITTETGSFQDESNGMYRTVAVNGGLWLNDPDIDALTRLERHLIVTGTNENMPRSFSLSPGTWSPWNCQNTAVSRGALASYFLSPYTGRHLDIWASYITTRIAEAQGEVISFGTPLAYHDRSPHNLYKDLEQELPWIQATDEFCDTLRSIDVPSTGYLDGLAATIEGLKEKWQHPVKDKYLEGLSTWHGVFKQL